MLAIAVILAPILGVLTYRAWKWDSYFWLMGFRFLAFCLAVDLTIIFITLIPSLAGPYAP